MDKVLERLDGLTAGSNGKGNPPISQSGIGTPSGLSMNRNKGPASSVVIRSGTTNSGPGGGSQAGPGGNAIVFGSLFHPNNNNGGGRYEYRNRKIDIPQFDGVDPDGWILLAERYFAIYQLLDEERITAAVLSLSGDALAWYRWSNHRTPLNTWEEVKDMFSEAFPRNPWWRLV